MTNRTLQLFRRHSWAVIFGALLLAFTGYALLDVFVLPRRYSAVEELPARSAAPSPAPTSSPRPEPTPKTTPSQQPEPTPGVSPTPRPESTADSYSDGDISITIRQYRAYETDIYVAEVTLSSPEFLKTALAEDTYGKNITESTSQIAAAHGAILAVNGDYYGARESGYVIRNGVLYRDQPGEDRQCLVIRGDGSLSVVEEGAVSAESLLDGGAVQVLSFGPGLVVDGEIAVTPRSGKGKVAGNDPRTAIAAAGPLHYFLIVCDGRTGQSRGLSLYELAEFALSLGCETAYNLDGGGSSAMVFNGTLVNRPTTTGRGIRERGVSDIVYIGR